jgi:hypothetical protein
MYFHIKNSTPAQQTETSKLPPLSTRRASINISPIATSTGPATTSAFHPETQECCIPALRCWRHTSAAHGISQLIGKWLWFQDCSMYICDLIEAAFPPRTAQPDSSRPNPLVLPFKPPHTYTHIRTAPPPPTRLLSTLSVTESAMTETRERRMTSVLFTHNLVVRTHPSRAPRIPYSRAVSRYQICQVFCKLPLLLKRHHLACEMLDFLSVCFPAHPLWPSTILRFGSRSIHLV